MKRVLTALEQAQKAKQRVVLLISYPTLRTAWSNRSALFSVRFNACVLDEGHFIRNHTSLLHHAVCAVRANHRLVLSGTPVQNCLDDVFGVFAFIVPSYFPDYDRFFEHFVRPITRSFGSENREVLMTGASAARASPVASERIEELNRAIAPFLLRRTKEEVQLALPEKTLSDVLCPLSDCQRAVWEMAVRVRRRLSSYLQHCGQAEEPQQRLQQILAIDTHPLLCSAVHELACAPRIPVTRSLPLAVRTQLDSLACSGKLTVLKLLLEKALRIGDFADDVPGRRAEKVVVFSQKPQVLELVARQVLARYEGLRYAELKSAMTSEQRMAVVRSFQEDEAVALLLATTGISAYGYTLTAAQTVILVDHNFNPFVDLQAIDRCHRIGQTRAVSVYRLVSEEENESRLMK